ncbi:MAG: hypothetical protein ACRC9Q_03605 [Bacteroidales bacterium]
MKLAFWKYWSVGQWIRLIAGVILTIYGFWTQTYFILILSAIFIVQGIFNFSSCNGNKNLDKDKQN